MNTEKSKVTSGSDRAASPVKRLVMSVFCLVSGGHAWTSKAMEGLPPTPEQVGSGIAGFYDYAEMYCGKCGVISQVSKDWRDRNE